MARPYQHPKTKIYWLRKRVPDDLRAALGKTEEKKSLGTRDPEEAKRLHAEALLDLERRWANLRRPPEALTERRAHELAQPAFDAMIDAFRDHPSLQKQWDIEVGAQLIEERKTLDTVVRPLEERLDWAARSFAMKEGIAEWTEKLASDADRLPVRARRRVEVQAAALNKNLYPSFSAEMVREKLVDSLATIEGSSVWCSRLHYARSSETTFKHIMAFRLKARDAIERTKSFNTRSASLA